MKYKKKIKYITTDAVLMGTLQTEGGTPINRETWKRLIDKENIFRHAKTAFKQLIPQPKGRA